MLSQELRNKLKAKIQEFGDVREKIGRMEGFYKEFDGAVGEKYNNLRSREEQLDKEIDDLFDQIEAADRAEAENK